MTASEPSPDLPFVCPACRSAVVRRDDRYDCPACRRNFPILFGIPDFRIRPDRYLSIPDERAKAARLHAFAQTVSFDALVDHYYAITDDVPPELARTFARYVRAAPDRGAAILAAFAPGPSEATLLDIGCASGGVLIAAAHHARQRVGVDIGLRWLVICQKRLHDAGIDALLVCADIEALPFADGAFDIVIADDVIEHAYDPAGAVQAAARQVRAGGQMLVTAINQYWIGPHPTAGIWFAGLLPLAIRSARTRKRHGLDSLRNMGFVSPAAVMRAGRREGLTVIRARARAIDPAAAAFRSRLLGRAAAIYEWCRRTVIVRDAILWAGPTFEIMFRRGVDGGKG